MNDIFQQIVQFVQEQTQHNELFKGGLILGVGAALLAYARTWPRAIWDWIQYHCTFELDIPEGSEAFKWMDKWLAQHEYSKKRARSMTATSKRVGAESVPTLVPAPGRHWMFEGGRLIIFRRLRETLENASSSGKAYTESMTLTVLGRNRKPALQLLEKSFALADKPKETVEINYCDDYGGWFELSKRTPRPIDSIVLPGGQADRIVADAKLFFSRQQYYADRGIPWRRGYLFYGDPGNGKSSTIFALASELKMGLSYLNLREVNDTGLMRGMSDIPQDSILVIEDIDGLFNGDEKRETKSSVSFASLINALDGLLAPEGQLMVMTTNCRNQLDPALIRPGRADIEILFSNATLSQARDLFRRFYPWKCDIAFGEAYRALPKPMSMAALQGHFVVNETAEEASLSLRNLNEQT